MSPTPAPDAREAPAPPEGASLNQRRLAPRSSNQFRVGPPFSATTAGARLVASGHEHVEPRISARLDRGFDMIDGEWIGYKRNYFTLVAAFQFVDLPPDATATESFSYVDGAGEPRPVRAFKILLTSVCLEDSSTAVTLVQHTAKRDRGPQSSPPLYYAVPGDLPAHSTMKLVANIRNGDKIDRCNRLFYLLKEDHQRAAESSPHCVLATYPRDCDISLVARYERIQFLSAGCGNRKLASTNNKHYVLVVQLLGVTDLGLHVVLASSQSPPLIVRGRSPSNY
ncbi:p53-like transcription factor, partial [Metschnikowia bicuspidata var. bicuspidata NRRL YB-4993]